VQSEDDDRVEHRALAVKVKVCCAFFSGTSPV